MSNRLSNWLVAMLLIYTIGAHWMILQSVAWVGMIVTYSQQSTLTDAVAKTFDGKHPCEICKLVTEGKKAEKKPQIVKLENQSNFWLTTETVTLYPPQIALAGQGSDLSPNARSISPPTPPPRA